MNNCRNTIQKLLCLLAGVLLLAATFAAQVPIYQCTENGIVSFSHSKPADNTTSGACSCCQKFGSDAVAAKPPTLPSASVNAECCHEIDIKLIDLGQSQSLRFALSALTHDNGVCWREASAALPRCPDLPNQILSRTSPPIYLLKQTFLI